MTTKTILVADDSKTMQRIVELTFKTSAFSVLKVSSADEALREAQRSGPDVILADTQMPEKDGYQLCQELRGNPATAHIPVLLLSGNFEPFDEARAQAVQANGHIKKPFDSQSLINQVAEMAGAQVETVAEPMSFASRLAAKRDGTPAPTPAASPVPAAPPSVPAPAPTPAAPSIPPPAPPPVAAAPPAEPMFVAPRSEPEPEMLPNDDFKSIPPDAAEVEMMSGPGLEPPTPPSAAARAQAENVDMWSLAEPAEAPAPTPAPRAPSPPPRAPTPPPPAPAMASAVADAAAGPVADVASAAVPSLPREDLIRLAREVIEQVAWEIVPDLAETIIREEIRRLTQP